MNRKHLLQIPLFLLLLLPAGFWLFTGESRAEASPLASQAPVEQLVFVVAVGSGVSPSLTFYPARLNSSASAGTLYLPDTSAPAGVYSLASDAEISLSGESNSAIQTPISSTAFPAAYRSLIASGASPIFLMVKRDNIVLRLEYASALSGPTAINSEKTEKGADHSAPLQGLFTPLQEAPAD